MQMYMGPYDWMFKAGKLDVRAKNVQGQTPLIWAASCGMPLMVKHLLNAGAELTGFIFCCNGENVISIRR